MKIKTLNNFSLILNMLIFIIIGVSIIIWPKYLIDSLFVFIITTFIIKSISNLILSIFEIKWYKLILNVVYLVMEVLLIIFLLNEQDIFYSIFNTIFGSYIVLDGLVRLICFVMTYKEDIKKSFYYLGNSIISFTLSFLILFSDMSQITFILVGIYFILFGLAYGKDLLMNAFNYKKRTTRVSIPAILALVTPYLEYRKVLKNKKVKTFIKKNDLKPNLYISIHVGPKLMSKPGHIDICYNDQIISFGQYDKENLKFFKIFGHGVMYIVKGRKKYYEFAKEKDQKIIFEYGLHLNDEEEQKLKHKIKELKDNTYSWSSKLDYTYAYKLEHNLGAKLYKFKSGEFKNYFSPRNNCVFLADAIMKAINIDNLSLGSFVIPGSYYNYLEEQLKIKNSNVITKKIYI